MKRTLSFMLTIVMVFSVFVTMPFVKVEAKAVKAADLFTIQSTTSKNGNVTYTIYLNPGVGVSGAVVCAEFNPKVASLVSGGAATAVDSYGDEYQKIPGMYVNGFVNGSDKRYSVGYLTSSLSSDYVCGKTKTPFFKFVFKPVKSGSIGDSVKFYCNEFTSISTPENNIANGTNALIINKPATPKLSAIANTASGVKVTWGKASGADSYIVYRKTYDAKAKKWGAWTNIAKGVTSTSYIDKTAKSGTYYLYTIKAVNEAGNSGYNTSGIKTYFISTPTVSATNSNSGVAVKWTKSAGATGYIVYRKSGNGSWQRLATVKGAGTLSYTDKTAKAGVTYRYTVKAYYSSYFSAYNTNGFAVRRLTTPSLKSVASAKSGVTFTWNKVSGATGYMVYRKTGNGSWQKIATVNNTKISYLDKSAKKGVTYTYTVKAYYGTSTSYYNTKGLQLKISIDAKIKNPSKTDFLFAFYGVNCIFFQS